MDARRTAKDAVREVVERHAPSELSYLEQVTQMCVEDPDAMDLKRGRPGKLAIDIPTLLIVVTPILYSVLNDLAKDAIVGGLHRLWRTLRPARRNRSRFDPHASLEAFTPEQVEHAKALIRRRLMARGWSAEAAAAIADDFGDQLGGAR